MDIGASSDPGSAEQPGFEERRLSFGDAAEAYDAHRPTYPAEAVRWLLGATTPETVVVDVGAGTGALTRVLAGQHVRVVAVEPDDGMRAALLAARPDVDARPGSAEDLPLEDGSADVVVAGQAFHWFDPPRAAAEFARVLRPGGAVGLIWNIRVADHGWLRDFDAIIGGEDAVRTRRAPDWLDGVLGPRFTDLAMERFPFAVTHTADSLVGLTNTFSYVRLRPDSAAVLDSIRELVGTHPDTAGRDTFDLEYVATTYRATLL